MRKRGFVAMTAALLMALLSGCGPTSPSSSAPSSSSSEEASYDSRNFVEPANEVTTTKLVTYDGPQLFETSPKVGISVDGHDLFVYETRVNHARLFTFAYSTDTNPVAIFDFEGKVHVTITVYQELVSSAIVRPLMYGIKPACDGHTISFDLTYSGNYVIEYNGNPDEAIHLFANPIEQNPIYPESVPAKTIYIGPGVYDAGAIPLDSGSTLYLAGGAYVFGQIRTEGLHDITIRGRGIIDGEIYDRTTANQFTIPIEVRSCQNIDIEDIAILDPAGWAIALYKSSDIALTNVKIMTARANGDGISVQSCSRVTVKGGFVRTWDDSLVVKNVDRGTTSDITFDGVTVWTDLAQSMEVGYETNGPTMDGITFKNIVVLHNYHKAAMSIHNCDDAIITNVKYQNITIEDGEMRGDDQSSDEDDYFIDILIAYNAEWTKSGGARGNINGVAFENIKAINLIPTLFSRINGESEGSDVKNVAFLNIDFGGTPVRDVSALKLVTNDFVSGISCSYNADDITGAVFTLPYKLALADQNVEYGNSVSPAQTAPIVPSFAWMQGDLSYAGTPASGAFQIAATHGAGSLATTPVDDGSGADEEAGYEAAKAIDGDRATAWRSKPWVGQDNEFVGLTVDFGAQENVGQIRLLGLESNVYSFDYLVQVWGRKMKTDGSGPSDKYVRILSSKTYQMSPRGGNAIDLIIPSSAYFGLQLRFFAETGFMAPSRIEVAEVQFFAPSLTFNKPVVDGSQNADVYILSNLTDGVTAGTSYYESAFLPAFFVIDLKDVYDIRVIVMCLPPSYLWDPRTENIEIMASSDNSAYSAASTAFRTIVPRADYLFDPASGNLNVVTLPNPEAARYLKFVFYSNDATGGYGAQMSEVKAYA